MILTPKDTTRTMKPKARRAPEFNPQPISRIAVPTAFAMMV